MDVFPSVTVPCHTAKTTTSVLIADDHLLVRVGITALLQQLDEFTICGEASNGAEAITQIEMLNPDIVLMDVLMPGMTGLSAVQHIKQYTTHATLKIVMLSSVEAPETVIAALNMGVDGYLLKDCLLAELEQALYTVKQGQRYLSPKIADLSTQLHAEKESAHFVLTSQQQKVLTAIAQGLSAKQIAKNLEISPKTVEFHRNKIAQKLGCRDLAGLVKAAVKMGLVSI